MEIHEFLQKQSLPYEAKIAHAQAKAREFYEHMDGNVYCSVGGLDSLTLLAFLRLYVSKDIPAVSVSSLEDKSIQLVHNSLDNFITLAPSKSKVQVIREYGYPIISKVVAYNIEAIQNPTEKNKHIRYCAMTCRNENVELLPTRSERRVPKKWLELFGGPENDNFGTNYKTAPFKVSSKCCYYMKEKPCNNYTRETKRQPYLGLMASEGGRRRSTLIFNGCNLYGKKRSRSCPFSIFSRNDLLQLALDLNVQVPTIYGTIKRGSDGMLYTTGAERTGCTMCGFGIHLDKRPHHFDLLRASNPKEWHFWVYDMGWGEVLSYIGVEWEDDYYAGILPVGDIA